MDITPEAPLLPWQRWAVTASLTAGRGPSGHRVTVRAVSGYERVWCSCGAELPFDRNVSLHEAAEAIVRRHLDEVAGLN